MITWLRALRTWAREEVRLMRLDTWQDEFPPLLGSAADPRVARMDLKRRAMGKRMRKKKRSLLSGKPYTPETMAAADPKGGLKSLKTIRLRDAA